MPEEQSTSQVVRLLMEHRAALFSFIYTAVRDFDVAEEVFQEVSVAVCESHASFRTGTNFSAWAREIARRRILAEWRSTNRFPGLLSDDALRQIQAGFDNAESHWTVRNRMSALRSCLSTLSPTVRRMLELRYVNQLSMDEIATQMERKGESIRKALYRTRRALCACIDRRLRADERP